jgi:hypothetical protein
MDNQTKESIIETSWQIHQQVEESYLGHGAKKGDSDWPDKQRLLLADMSLHLLQTALNPTDIELEKLRNNLHSILTISDQFLPDSELKTATERLFP